MAVPDNQAKSIDSTDFLAILASQGVEFLLSGKGKFTEKSKRMALKARPCKSFTPQLVQLYDTLIARGKELEIVFISFDHDKTGFEEHFKCMPWLAVPFDVTFHKELRNRYQVDRIPSLIPLASDGITVSELAGKTIGLYFGAHWCPPCRAFTIQLIEVYNELKTATDQCFEIVLVSTDRDHKEFDLNLSSMPWLAIPYEDRTRQDLCRIFKIKGIPALVLIGPDGKTINTNGKDMISLYGAKAFPFTEWRIDEIEASLKKEGDALPQLVKDAKHEHELKLDMAKAYQCDSCKKPGRFWTFSCDSCNYDLHPSCVEGVDHPSLLIERKTSKSSCLNSEERMWMSKTSTSEKKETKNNSSLVAVAIDRDKGSQNAIKWTIDNILYKGQTLVLIHVKLKSAAALSPSPSLPPPRINQISDINGDSSLINCKDVVLEDSEVSKALIEYVSQTAIETLVVGASGNKGFLRFHQCDPPHVLPHPVSPLRNQLLINQGNIRPPQPERYVHPTPSIRAPAPQVEAPPRKSSEDSDFFRSPFTRRGLNGKSYGELPLPDSDISYVSSGRPSIDRIFPGFCDGQSTEGRTPPRLSNHSDVDSNYSFESIQIGRRSLDCNSQSDFSSVSQDYDRLSSASQTADDVEAEMRRLRLELKQTMEMYSTACKEALSAKQRATELQRWKMEEERRLEEARLAEEAAIAVAEREKAKSKAAIEAAEAAQRIAEMEAQKRRSAERKALKEGQEKKKALTALAHTDVRYRKYSIEEIESATEFFSASRKIGEGGYGPVYKCNLDHTPVAIKVLRPDAAQGRSQFQQEVEVLSCIRHPNMVLLLGACPEYGCLVYEFMANGSLDDRLFRRGHSPALSWQLRFKVAAEIGTALLFLHQTKPEPLVHRDLKPANILLDRNFVSKISDVGLARLVPPTVADTVTQYRMTSTAGTFCYIDPEYQQTGMLAKPPMGLTHHVERAIEKGTFEEMLDPAVPDWPVEEALSFAKLSLQCAELRRKDRPDLGKVVLPELNRLRALAEETMNPPLFVGGSSQSPFHSQVSSAESISDPQLIQSSD
ncbi:hypothetical protein Patl1_12748 [Pistacia atlantica]|uniref:Uncharacterized protein n=1 Tax=Pistacia atlantica TaxID=434234 RepID=A0ACC1AXB8_9ROSI|nr:hypothetical protein Patl1_12748 [Pistacia atlantica]